MPSRRFVLGVSVLLVVPLALVLEHSRLSTLSSSLHALAAAGDTAGLVAALRMRRGAVRALNILDDAGRSVRDIAEEALFPDVVELVTEAGGREGRRLERVEAARSVVDAAGAWAIGGTDVGQPWWLAWARRLGLGAPGLSCLVVEDGKVIFESVTGYADVRRGVAADGSTPFLVGSVTKQFVAAAVLRLQDAGLLDVKGDTIAKWFPDFPRGDEVTLAHLLTHTSGVRSYTVESGVAGRANHPAGYFEQEWLVERIGEMGFSFAPGEKWYYSNSGYLLLGFIVEKVSGKELGEYLREAFFVPLGMNATGMLSEAAMREYRGYGNGVVGYSEKRLGFGAVYWKVGERHAFHPSLLRGAGGLFSTARDLARWNEAVFGENEEALSKAALKQALAPVVLNDGSTYEYGFGWFVPRANEAFGVTLHYHRGGVPGHSAWLFYHPGTKTSIVTLAKVRGLVGDMKRPALAVGWKLVQIWMVGMRPPGAARNLPTADASISEEDLSKFIGQFDFSNETNGHYGPLIIERDEKNGALVANGFFYGGNTLIPVSSTRLALRQYEPVITFSLADDSNEYGRSLVLERKSPGRKVMVGRRLGDPKPCAWSWGRRLPSADVEKISQCTGKYRYGLRGAVVKQARLRPSILVVKFPGEVVSLKLVHMSGLKFCFAGDDDKLSFVEFSLDNNGSATMHLLGHLPQYVRREGPA